MALRTSNKQEFESAVAAGTPLPLLPLILSLESCVNEKDMNANFFATLNRGYVPVNDYLGKFHGIVSLVGSGPSIAYTYRHLKGDVCAVNSAIKFLLDHDIVPKWGMLWDAAEIVEQFAIPHPDITYLVASRCHPKVFERLQDCKVVVWHAAGDHNIVEIMNHPEVIAKQKQEEPLINGGSAGITRGIYVVNALGYQQIHIYGGDSSYRGNKTHIRGSLVPEKDVMVSIGNDPPIIFRTTPEWCAQVEEYRDIFTTFAQYRDHCLEVHGSGMLQTMHKILVAKKKLQGKDKFVDEIIKQRKEQNELNNKILKSAEEHANA